MLVQRIENTAEFERLGEEWNPLLAASNARSVFLTWEWLHAWWKHLSDGRRLSILAMRQAGALVGIAPLAVRPALHRRMLPFQGTEFLGCGTAGSDYLDFIVRPESEEAA